MYYLVYGIFYLLSLLPMPVLYGISDFAYWIIYRVAGYRKKVVMNNLDIAFPEKTREEKLKIAAGFYRNLTDTFIETIKLVSASDRFIKKHVSGDFTILKQLQAKGRKCQVHLGHNFNWEYANLALPLDVPYLFLCVYMPINNKPLDRLFRKIRSRSGSVLLPATEMRTAILPYRNETYLLALVADQNPGNPQHSYWMNFFGRPTPFVKGPEKGARANDTAVVFAHITKTKRGYYEVHLDLASEHPHLLPESELTKIYTRYLEKVIRAHPEMWLWSHRRWKHQWQEGYMEVVE